MGVFQASVGYRDPAKSMTLKALEQRLKTAQEQAANATQMTQPVSDPMQGYAYLGNILAGGIKEGMAAGAAAGARDELAKIKAGIDWTKGPTGEQYAQMSQIDPEGADKIMQDWTDYRQDMEKQAKQNEFTTSERVAGEQFTTGRDTAQQTFQTSERVAGEVADEVAAVADDKRTADQKIADEQTKLDTQRKEMELRKEEYLKLNPGADLNSPEAQAFILRNAAPPTDPTNTRLAWKDVNDLKLQGNDYDRTLTTIGRAKELAPQILTGDAGKIFADVIGKTGFVGNEYIMPAVNAALAQIGKPPITPQQLAATKEFFQIVGMDAVKDMSRTLKGQTSNRELDFFTSAMADAGADLQTKLNALTRMEKAILTDRSIVSETLVRQYGADPLADYKYTSDMGSAPPATPAPADAGGGGGTTTPPAQKPASEMTPEERAAERARLQGGG